MSDILETLNVSTVDIVGANKVAGSSSASQDTVDSGVPFSSHLQAATASQKLTETQTAEPQALPGSAAAGRSPSEDSLISETKTARPEVVEEKLPADLIDHKNRVAFASPQPESGGSRLPAHLSSDDKDVVHPESDVNREQTITHEQRVAALGSNLIASEHGDSQVPPELDNTGHEVVAGNSERLPVDGQNAHEEAVAAQNFSSVELNGESDSLAPSVSLTTVETSSSVDSPQLRVNTQNKMSSSHKSDNPAALSAASAASDLQHLQHLQHLQQKTSVLYRICKLVRRRLHQKLVRLPV